MASKFIDLFYTALEYLLIIVALIWPIILMIFAWRLAYLLFTFYGDRVFDDTVRRKRFRRMGNADDRVETLHKIRTLHPREFEFYIADLLAKNGYKTKVVGRYSKPDGGIDIIARRDGNHYLVQCKKYIDRDVGVKQVREFYGAGVDVVEEKKAKMILFSTTYFTVAARKFAKKKGIRLVDGDYLLDLVFARESMGQEIGLDGHERDSVLRNVPPACPVCTRQLAWRKGPHGIFVGCTGYPGCKYVFSDPNNKTGQVVA